MKPVPPAAGLPGVVFSQTTVVLGRQKDASELVLEPVAQRVAGEVLRRSVRGEVRVSLRSGERELGATTVDAAGRFAFVGVLPGEYVVRVRDEEGCFGEKQEAEQAVDVREASVTSLRFEETGFRATVVSPVPLQAESLSQEGSETLAFPAGESHRCLQAPQYQLALSACAEVASPVVLSAASHRLEVTPSAYHVDGSIALSAGVGVDVAVRGSTHRQVRVAAEQNGRVVSEVAAVKDGERFLYRLVVFPLPCHADAGARRVRPSLLCAQHALSLPSRVAPPLGGRRSLSGNAGAGGGCGGPCGQRTNRAAAGGRGRAHDAGGSRVAGGHERRQGSVRVPCDRPCDAFHILEGDAEVA